VCGHGASGQRYVCIGALIPMWKRRLLFFSLIFLACAKEGFPPGGPEDKTPPRVVKTFPVQGQTFVPLNTKVIFWFSEPVRPKRPEKVVFISPWMETEPKIQWKGKRLLISFPRALMPNRTYVITVGALVTDYQNNAMPSSFSLAFSTGEKIDEGMISGRVYGADTFLGIEVWAYRVDSEKEPNPSQSHPDYIVQCDQTGAFQFHHIQPGRYRIFAVQDQNGDHLYQSEEPIGVPFNEIVPDSSGTLFSQGNSIWFLREDKAPCSLRKILVTDARHVMLQFDRPLIPLRQPRGSDCTILSVENPKDSLSVLGISLRPENFRECQIVMVRPLEGQKYVLRLNADWVANPPDSLFWKGNFIGSTLVDTSRPFLVWSRPKHGERFFSPFDSIALCFNEPVDTTNFHEGFRLLEHGADSSRITGQFFWPNLFEVRFLPDFPLKSKQEYLLQLGHKKIMDFGKNALPDTILRFRTLDIDTLSEISGRLVLMDSTFCGPFILTLTQIGASKMSYVKKFEKPGPYRFQNVLPGNYRLLGYLDQDKNGRYTQGVPFPFCPSERFVVYPDTIQVRSRWPNEGNDLVFP